MLAKIEDQTQFRVVRQIARGGMGSVCEALQLGADGFEKQVAIKELLPALCNDKTFVDMFIDEAKLVADLVHESIVQIYQLSIIDGVYYIIMEYVHGVSLSEFLRIHREEEVELPRELAVFIASRIARGLAYAHSRRDELGDFLNIVHRDVCPNNILITAEGLPKLGDFGIAKAAKNVTSEFSENQSIGKAMYMAPEQAWSKPVDHRSDIYSLGMVLFELLALIPARQRWSGNPIFAASKGRVDWDAFPEDVSDDLRGILEKMLALGPDDRYENSADLLHDLEYHIYHGGYGPTVVTLETHLRELFPHLYRAPSSAVE